MQTLTSISTHRPVSLFWGPAAGLLRRLLFFRPLMEARGRAVRSSRATPRSRFRWFTGAASAAIPRPLAWRYLATCGLAILWLSLPAQCLEGNCQNGEGVFVLANGNRYVGQFSRGEFAGQGALYYTDGSRYLGGFRAGQPHGEGLRLFPDGSRQQGWWQQGELTSNKGVTLTQRGVERTGCVSGNCREGQGTYLFPGGAIYSGEFRNGEINGEGVCYYPDGSRYQGQWQNRYPDGQGALTWPNGNSRVGRWLRGQPVDEQGRFLDPLSPTSASSNGFAIQSGCLRGNCVDGQGYYAYPDGSRYDGAFQRGLPHGQGVFYYPNGDQYTGDFAYGLRHHQGVLRYADGRTLSGQWRDGEFLPPPSPATAPTQGCIAGNCQDGFGTYVFRQGDRYVGAFRGGLPHGNGEVNYLNGERYQGGMAAGAFQGFGVFYQTNGEILRGQWEAGRFLGGAPAAASRPVGPRVWAVVIGVSSYRHMPVLRFPDDDAYRLYAFLKSPEGGALPDEQIRLLIDEDATLEHIRRSLTELFSQAAPQDLILLYFSGHGLPGAFLPIDYDGQRGQLTHQEIRRLLDASPARYQLVLADACHSGSLLAARGRQPAQLLNSYYETLANTRPGSALIMSSKSDETSLESSGLRQGVFSHYLLRGLKGEADANTNHTVTVQELFEYVSSQVLAYTGGLQNPVIQGSYDPAMPVGVVR